MKKLSVFVVGLAEDVRFYVKALRKPVLDYEDIAGAEGG